MSDSEGLLGSAGGNDNDVDNEAESDGEEGVVPMDRRTQCGLLEVSVVLWEEIEDKLTKKTHSKLRKRLVSRTEKNLPVFLEALTVSVAWLFVGARVNVKCCNVCIVYS